MFSGYFDPRPFLILPLFHLNFATNALSTNVSSSTVPSITFFWLDNSASNLYYVNHLKNWAEISAVLLQCYWNCNIRWKLRWDESCTSISGFQDLIHLYWHLKEHLYADLLAQKMLCKIKEFDWSTKCFYKMLVYSQQNLRFSQIYWKNQILPQSIKKERNRLLMILDPFLFCLSEVRSWKNYIQFSI